jgi:hypothetical protein
MFHTKLHVSIRRPSPSRRSLSPALMRPRSYPKSIALVVIALVALVALVAVVSIGESLLTFFSRVL